LKSKSRVNRVLTILIFLVIISIPIYLILKNSNKPPPVTNTNCDSRLWEHVYHKYRLDVIEECKTVSGTIERIKPEDDGDLHIQLKLDAGQENLLNDKNYQVQHGNLIIEPICVERVTQADARGPCSDYINNVKIPRIGEHVKVTGSYVNDKEHGWNEIHPVTAIEIINP
jgi:hypothetical protein